MSTNRLGVVLDYLTEHGYSTTLTHNGMIVVTDYASKPNRTATMPISYIEAKLFVEKKPPYDQ